eukprot:6189655-Pleurochrysis_carterae.AAC.1
MPNTSSNMSLGARTHPLRWHRIAEFQKLSLKLIADGLLRGSPKYASQSTDPLAKWLAFAAETSVSKLALNPPIKLQFSPFNPGAKEVAEELQARLAGLSLTEAVDSSASGLSDPAAGDTSASVGPLLLYLNDVTFVGDQGARLATTVRAARAAGTRIVLFHENDEALGGGPFSWCISALSHARCFVPVLPSPNHSVSRRSNRDAATALLN